MSAVQSRFAGLSSRKAWAVLLLLIAFLGLSLLPAWDKTHRTDQPSISEKTETSDPDILLYETIIERLSRGEAYYPVAAEELRAGNYPLRPFITFRLPTLAWASAALGKLGTQILVLAFGVGAIVTLYRALRASGIDAARAYAAIGLAIAGMTLLSSRHYLSLHELWAGTLMLFAFALHRPERWGVSLVIAALALFIRELALPFILLMGAFAFWHRRWREALGWAALVVAFGALMLLHHESVSLVVRPDDPPSPQWAEFGGWASALNFLHTTSAFRMLPSLLAYPLIILCIFGWIAWPSEKGLFGALLLCGYGVAFMLFGRANNFYWGLMVAPFLAIGIAFLRPAIADLSTSLLRSKLDSARD